MAGKTAGNPEPGLGDVDSTTTIFSNDKVEDGQACQYGISAVNMEGMNDSLHTEKVHAGDMHGCLCHCGVSETFVCTPIIKGKNIGHSPAAPTGTWGKSKIYDSP